MSKFEYPRLSRRDIMTILAESQIASISESDLVHPNPDSVANLYTKLLLYVDFLQEDYGQVEFAALEQLENPNMHVDSVRTMNLCHKIMEVVAAIHCPRNFTLKDLLHPDGGRTEFFVSAILNFSLHREAKMNFFSPIVEDFSLRDEEQRELEDRISQLNSEISEYNEAREREMPLVQEVDAKVKELRHTIPGLNNHQLSLRTSHKRMNEKAGEMDGKMSSAEFIMVQSIQENANLRAKIVQSPEKLQRDLEEKKSVQHEATNLERLAMQSFQEKTAIDEVSRKALKKMSKHSAQIQAIQEQVNSAKSIEKDVKVLKAKLSEDKVLYKSLEAKLVERQGKAEQLDESRSQLEKERDSKCDEVTKELNNVKLEAESRRPDLGTRQRKVEDVISEVDAVTSKIRIVKEYGAFKHQEFARKCEEIVKELYQYSNSIAVMLPTVAELEIHHARGAKQYKKHKL